MKTVSDFANTISLIGMPGSGKSTVGVLLAKQLGMRFVDTDLEIQLRAGSTLQEILERNGFEDLRMLEERVLLETNLDNAVVATGGSAVYSKPAMVRLKLAGPLVHLETELQTLKQRIEAAPPRGIASDPALSLAAIFAERNPLYRRHANIIIDTNSDLADEVATATIAKLQSRNTDQQRK